MPGAPLTSVRMQAAPGPGAIVSATFDIHAGATLLPQGGAVAIDDVTGNWVPYRQPSDAAVFTINANSTAATAGLFTLKINGHAIQFGYNFTAAQIESLVNYIAHEMEVEWRVACVATTGANLGVNSAVVTMTFTEAAGAPAVRLDPTGLTGNAHTLGTTDAGTTLNRTNKIRGFVYDAAGIQLSAGETVVGNVMVRGFVDGAGAHQEAVLALLDGSPTEGELDTAMQHRDVAKLGLVVVGL